MLITPIISAPTSVPMMVPLPPNRLVPPRMHGGDDVHLQPLADIGPAGRQARRHQQAAQAGGQAGHVSASSLMRSVLTPEKRAASRLPPVACT